MVAPLKQQRELKDELFQDNSEPKFQEFQEFNTNSAKFRELLFFARIAFFGVTTVVIAFMLLALNLAPLWAFLFALLASLAITSAVSTLIWSLKQ
ncbi:DUF3270 domain-containing protein [Streptococcus caballi]|uniref:DUF3270 domain-containing protein n=1 Tax=Streptococcus caballi TaxID=439220 RepID=UPI00036435F9|nr:DUF3270 domain-containing protein [Streptococcus caballi]